MCGIAAVIDAERPVDPATMDRMRDRLAHRGPDDAGTWIAPRGRMSVGLGSRRLKILDLSDAGHQPMLALDGQVAITFNGLLYNFVELREELEREGMSFRTRCDTEVLLAAYLAWGREFVPRLNGMFAFAIYDARSESVLVARDRFGEKPLYSARLPEGGWAFASEIKALLAHPRIDTAVDQVALTAFIESGHMPLDRRVLFAGVEEFPAAHAMSIDCRNGAVRTWRYWTPDYGEVDTGLGVREASDELARHLDRSVAMRLRADVPIGAFLSGGLDSSTIVGALWEQLDDPAALTVYSARFDDDPSISEGPFMDAVLRERSFPLHPVSPEPELLADSLDRLLWHHEQPIPSASMFLEWEVLRHARESGRIVMLDGQGADELLAGYEHFFRWRQLDLATRGETGGLRAETARYRARLAGAAEDYPEAARRFADQSIGDDELELYARQARRAEFPPPAPEDLLPGVPRGPQSGFVVRRLARLPGFGGVADRRAAGSCHLRQRLARAMLYESLPRQLHSADRNAMAFGIETRFPFLDYELVDWAVHLPDELLIRWGWHKYVLRTAAWRRIPEAVRWRRDKVGFMPPQDAWLRGPLRDWAQDLLLAGPIVERPEYARFDVPRLWHEHRDRAANHSDVLWRFLSANRWLQMYEEAAWTAAEPALANG